ncbi:LuxR C-terminal-related transcriptional regulator [Streptomyces sp. NBC_01136]|uniref:helix-turn-helix transcriptional regulator n=1 Tax=unclassified Streptomyces TaxID=2593676 RepID=UPI003243714C|nr:LuxR C-terminal-related transcriptional regulator [Streptomyces sp. NBC_01136]
MQSVASHQRPVHAEAHQVHAGQPRRHPEERDPAAREQTETAPLDLAILADDHITEQSVAAYLRNCPRIRLRSRDLAAACDVLLILTDEIDATALETLHAAREEGYKAATRVVVVTDRVNLSVLPSALDLGVVTVLLRRESDMEQVVKAVLEPDAGQPRLPSSVVRSLVDRLRAMQPSVEVPGSREIEVLRLLAEGLDTAEIATELHYSERTIKHIVQTMCKRLGLRNRAHAVAYGFRSGLL